MALRFFNTLTAREEEFIPLDPAMVRMYTCGPTVYNYAHIGNYRTFVFQDLLRRYLKYRGYRLLHVMNITDVEDKIIRNAQAAGQTIDEYTERYIQAFLEDTDTLRIERPELVVRATRHIPDMVELIQRLEQKGLTYRSDGSIYFRIAAFPGYGSIARLDLSGIKAGARVEVDEYEKEHPSDFALWKAPKEGEVSWDTPFGPGRPGWHIECSAMSMKYLGETLDIHTGGADLVFPHHANEIAQSEGATGKPFVRYWLHCEHLMVEGRKMSKSLGNQYTLRDLLAQGYQPDAIRYVLASVPYRKHLNFTFDGLHQASASLERLRNFRLRLQTDALAEGDNPQIAALLAAAVRSFEDAMDDNLNTAAAMGVVFDTLRALNIHADAGEMRAANAAAAQDLLRRFDSVFAVLEPPQPAAQSGAGDEAAFRREVEELLAQRAEARKRKDFAASDRIRQELAARGVVVEDTKDGVRWKKV
jgi:cysteinyl-tRNA synthetase